MNDSTTGGPMGWRSWLGISGALVVVGVVVILTLGGDEPEAPTPSTTTTQVPATTTSTPTAGTEGNATATVSSNAAPVTRPPPSTTTPPEPEPPTLPSGSIPQSDESATCRAIMKRLEEYRDLAASSPLSVLPTLIHGLEEFEHEIDFLAEGHDWGNQIIEHVVVVRRDWVTAYSAGEAGDEGTATDRFESAMDSLDDALSVECPAS